MSHREPGVHSADATQMLRSAFKSQFHAALAMLRQAIERCPEDLWSSRDYANPFWRIAYHTLYYTHLYLQPHVSAFRPWEHHQTRIQDLDEIPAPPEIEDLCELPHRPPQTGEPYTKAQVLEYWSVCERMVDGVDALNVLDSESGFPWHRMPKAEHQIMSIRHIQHHTAQLGVRLREAADTPIDWVRAGRSAEPHVTG
jgi:hypothetical protein